LAVGLTALACHGAEQADPAATGPAAGAADRFPNAVVLRERTLPDAAPRRFRHVRTLRDTTFKYPLIRHEQLLERVGARPRVLRESYAVADHFMVKLQPGATRADLEAFAAGRRARIRRALRTPRLFLVAIPESDTDALPDAIAAFNAATSIVAYAEADAIVTLNDTFPNPPNDPYFQNGNLWGLHNTGQVSGTVDADIDAPEAWNFFTGSRDMVVGLIDGGTDYNHVDLASNIWTNPGEIPGNDLDDDGNGFVDDVHGYDFYNEDGDPMDDTSSSHGTHTAGTIGALGNNGVGVAGVCWRVTILPTKMVSAAGSGPLSDAVEAVNYTVMMRTNGVNVRVTNSSWGDTSLSLGLSNSIVACAKADMLFACSAGNDSRDVDTGSPYYPVGFSMTNIIGVAATDRNDLRAQFPSGRSSNYGATSVDLAAPGHTIYSTTYNNNYGVNHGTSMSSPHVAGAAALLWAMKPSATFHEIRQAILDGVDPIASMAGITVTGGRLNLRNAMLLLEPAIRPLTGNVTNGAFTAYAFDASVEPYPMIDTNRVWMFWNTDGATNSFATNLMERVSNDLFRASIPTQSVGTTIYYYLSASTVSNLTALEPPGAPAALSSFHVVGPVSLTTLGSPEDYGGVSPSYGATAFPSGAVVHASATPYANEQAYSRLRCEGWTGTASVPAEGVSNTVSFTIRRNSYLIWRWKEQRKLIENSDPAGWFGSNSWWNADSFAQTRTAGSPWERNGTNYMFVEWRLDGIPQPTGATVNPLTGIAMTTSRIATAWYLPRERDADGDRMEDWREYHVYGTTNVEPAMRILPDATVSLLAATDRVTNQPLTLLNVGGTNLAWTLRTGWTDRIGPGAGEWTHGGTWDLWAITSRRSYSTPHAWFCGAGAPPTYVSRMNASLRLPPVRLNAGATLQFRHWIDSELDPAYPTQAYDGGIVEISTNAGTTYKQIAPVGDYPYLVHEHVNSTWTNEIRIFAGTGGWQQAAFDLGAYAGRDARLRFRFGSDWNTEREGWYIDDVTVLNGGDTNLWLSAAPTNGAVAAGGSNAVSVIVDTDGLPTGERRGLIRIVNNDPLLPTNDVEVVLMVDADPPSAAGANVVLSYSQWGDYVVANSVTGSWSGFTDALSGVAGYYYGPTNQAFTTNGVWTTGLSGALAAAPDQTNSFYVWARDGVGLVGGAVGATILALDPTTDFDADGALNAEEEVAGTDAANDDSVFAVTSAGTETIGGTQRLVVISWPTITDRHYSLHRTATLTNTPPDWQPLMTNRPGTGVPMAYTDDVSAVDARFYRVGVE
jgi:subtilisin family serine protease